MTTILRNIEVPTGNILIIRGEKGRELECLSIGDYGKQANIKADFLGLSDEINGVKADTVMPLTEKWVITISTQYGCSMKCKFCDVPKVGPGFDCTKRDLFMQIEAALSLHPDIYETKRLNLHYARMGEPTWNWDVIEATQNLREFIRPYLGDSLVHPVVSTMLPKGNRDLIGFLLEWSVLKNMQFNGDAGLQFSINSTNDKERENMFSGSSLSLGEISEIANILPEPVGRKYALNFALCGYEVDGMKLAKLFDPYRFMCKITPMHETSSCKERGLITTDGYNYYYPYKETEESLKAAGFDTLVFVPSRDEDESRITCGNAILSDKRKVISHD